MIKALVFDFDGLILDTETPIIDAWVALHHEAGIQYTRADAARIVGHVDIPFDPWHAFDAAADRAALEQEHKRRTRVMVERQPILPGIETCLREAGRRGLQLAIASNSTHAWVDRHLQRLGLYSYFHVIRCRDDVARGKPEPELYLSVLAALDLDAPEAIAFEDSTPGSLAAKRAGLRCVAIPNPSTIDHDFSHVDLTLGSLSDTTLDALLGRWS